MKELCHIHFKTRSDFRNWLLKHHDQSPGIWMVFYKKHTKKVNILYPDALDEAICFGWIDSIVKKTDEDQYVRKFTPRKNTRNWSEINRIKALKLIREGRMTETGLEKFEEYLKSHNTDPENNTQGTSVKKVEIPSFMVDAFAQNEPALIHFNNLAPSHKKNYVLWITQAKRKETVEK